MTWKFRVTKPTTTRKPSGQVVDERGAVIATLNRRAQSLTIAKNGILLAAAPDLLAALKETRSILRNMIAGDEGEEQQIADLERWDAIIDRAEGRIK